jgi:superfamily II DNA/RNA helicase
LEKRGIEAQAIHSGRSQVVRSQLLEDFKSGQIKLLVATGIAARGIDIDDLQRVVNYDLPDDADDYIHRIGRTGRAGAQGEAISLVSRDDFKRLCAIEGRQQKLIERRDIEGFGAQKTVPDSVLNHIRKAATSKTRGHGNKPAKKEATRNTAKPGKSAKPDANNTSATPVSTSQPWGNWHKDNNR